MYIDVHPMYTSDAIGGGLIRSGLAALTAVDSLNCGVYSVRCALEFLPPPRHPSFIHKGGSMNRVRLLACIAVAVMTMGTGCTTVVAPPAGPVGRYQGVSGGDGRPRVVDTSTGAWWVYDGNWRASTPAIGDAK